MDWNLRPENATLKAMPAPRLHGLYGRVALRAMQDALYEHEIDLCWEEVKSVFNRPEIRKAEAMIMHALAESFASSVLPGKRRRRPSRETIGFQAKGRRSRR